jgi:hypothetical protein
MITEETKTELSNFNEVETFFFIDSVGGFIWRIHHDAGHGRVTITPEMNEELNTLAEKQKFCVDQLIKFGVDPESAKDRTDGDYWKWFKHWKNWLDGIDDETWEILDHKMSNKEDYQDMLPKTKWNDIIPE